MEDKILIWLNSKPLISVNRLCKMVDYNMSNFQKSAKQGIVPLKIRSRLVEVLSEYGYSETTDYEIPKMFDAQRVERKDDEFRIPAQPIEEVDYEKLFNDCEFPEERKSLWERIKLDGNMLEKERMQWKMRLNAK